MFMIIYLNIPDFSHLILKDTQPSFNIFEENLTTLNVKNVYILKCLR